MEDKTTAKTWETRIRKAVKSQGRYTADLEVAIKIAARNVQAYMLAAADVAALDSTYYQTLSREGNIEFKEHPAIKTQERCYKIAAASLKDVGLTLSTISESDEDPLMNLTDQVNGLLKNE